MKQKILVYLFGVALGLVLLGFIQKQRTQGDDEPERFLEKTMESLIESSGLRNLPEGSPDYLRRSQLHGYLKTQPDASGHFSYIWILEVEEGHPLVRVVESLAVEAPGAPWVSRGFAVMAADEVWVRLAEDAHADDLDAVLSERGWERGIFYESGNYWTVRIQNHAPLSVPKATQWLGSHDALVAEARPRPLNWK